MNIAIFIHFSHETYENHHVWYKSTISMTIFDRELLVITRGKIAYPRIQHIQRLRHPQSQRFFVTPIIDAETCTLW